MKIIDLEKLPGRKERQPKFLKEVTEAVSKHVTGKAVVFEDGVSFTGARSALLFLQRVNEDSRAMKIISRGDVIALVEAD